MHLAKIFLIVFCFACTCFYTKIQSSRSKKLSLVRSPALLSKPEKQDNKTVSHQIIFHFPKLAACNPKQRPSKTQDGLYIPILHNSLF